MISAPGLARSALRLAGFHGVTMWVSASAPSRGGLEGAETDCEEWVRDTAGGADLAPDWGSGCGCGDGGRGAHQLDERPTAAGPRRQDAAPLLTYNRPDGHGVERSPGAWKQTGIRV